MQYVLLRVVYPKCPSLQGGLYKIGGLVTETSITEAVLHHSDWFGFRSAFALRNSCHLSTICTFRIIFLTLSSCSLLPPIQESGVYGGDSFMSSNMAIFLPSHLTDCGNLLFGGIIVSNQNKRYLSVNTSSPIC